jgi:hypothetical protein
MGNLILKFVIYLVVLVKVSNTNASIIYQEQPPTPYTNCLPSIGTVSNFTIFTSTGAISNTTSSNITGNIGTNVGAVSGFETSSISGTIYTADNTTQIASSDLSTAYTAYQNIPATNTHTPSYGSGETITSGVYNVAAGSIAGTLILDAQNNPNAKFIMQFSGAFTTGAGSNVILINSASANNIYWIVNGAASLAANTNLTGTVMANGAISVGVGCNLNSKLLSIAGAISTYGTIISNNGIDNSSMYYADNDQDGYGNPNISSCVFITGYVTNDKDCDDVNGITTWNGNSWSNGESNSTKSAIFSGNYIINSNFNACSIRVSNNSTVIVNTGNNVYLYGKVMVDTGSSFILNNNTNLLQTDMIQSVPSAVNIGNIIVKRNTSTIVRLDHTLWSSPVTGQNLYNFSPMTLTYRFYTYDTNTNQYLSSTLNSTSEFIPTKGFAVRAPNNQSSTIPAVWLGTFTGVPNNGTKYFTLDTNSSGYNLVGNPYPSTIDVNKFYIENSLNISSTIQFYQHTLTMDAQGVFPAGTNYATWTYGIGGVSATSGDGHTPAVAPNDIIQVGQGFMVHAIHSGDVRFNNSIRITNQSNQFIKTSILEEQRHRIWLNLKSGTNIDINQILIGYVTNGTNGLDKCDGLSYGNIGSFLYSTINGDNKYVIQSRSLPFSDTDEVSLGFNCSVAGNFNIELNNIDGLFLSDQDIFIRDNLTGIDTNIKLGPCTFTSEIGIFNNRFTIVYHQLLVLPSYTTNDNSVFIYKDVNWFNISTTEIIKDVLVYDMTGRLIYKINDISDDLIVLNGLYKIDQVLLVNIVLNDGRVITKKIIN